MKKSAKKWFELGMEYFNAGRFPEAISHFDKARRIDYYSVKIEKARQRAYIGLINTIKNENIKNWFNTFRLNPHDKINLSEIGEYSEVVKSLIPFIESGPYREKKAAAIALAIIGDKSISPYLIKALDFFYDEPNAKYIITALGNMGEANVAEKIMEYLESFIEWEVRTAAFKALTKLGWTPKNEEEKIRYLISGRKWVELKELGSNVIDYLIEELPYNFYYSKEFDIMNEILDFFQHFPEKSKKELFSILQFKKDLRNYDMYYHAVLNAARSLKRTKICKVEDIARLLETYHIVYGEEISSIPLNSYSDRAIFIIQDIINDLKSKEGTLEQFCKYIFSGHYLGEFGVKVTKELADIKSIIPLYKQLVHIGEDIEDMVYDTVMNIINHLIRLPGALDEIIKASNSPDSLTRESAIRLLSKFKDKKALDRIIAALADEDHFIIAVATDILREEGLYKIVGPRIISPLIRVLGLEGDKYDSGLAMAINNANVLLEELRAVEQLIKALESNNWRTNCEATRILGEIGDKKAIEPLKKLLKDAKRPVREVVQDVLKKYFGLAYQ